MVSREQGDYMASTRVTSLVCAYYPERFSNVNRIIDDLLNSTHRSDEIILLNNNEAHQHHFDERKNDGIKIISGWNTECRGKYIAALLSWADYYLMMDDDITVSPRTLEMLLHYSYPDLVAANRGVLMRSDSFQAAEIIDADKVNEPTAVDSIHGSGAFMSHAALCRMLILEARVRSKWPTVGDDIIAGFANKGSVTIYPLHGDSAFIQLDQCGVAMCNDADYFGIRDDFTRDLLTVLP